MGWDMGEAKATSKRGSFGKGVHHSCFATRRCVNGLEGGRGKVSGESLRAGWPFVWIARVEINMERALRSVGWLVYLVHRVIQNRSFTRAHLDILF